MPSARAAAAARSDTTSTFCAPPADRSRDASASARSTCTSVRSEPFDAAFQQGVGHGGPGAASAEEQHLPTLRAGQPAEKTLLEPPHVGVVACAPAAAEHHGVDRAKDLGCLGKLVEQRDDFLLVRKGDVKAGEAEMPCKRDDICQWRGGVAHRLGVQQCIDVSEPLRATLRLVHRRRAGKLNSPPQQADQQAARTRPRLPILDDGGSGRRRQTILPNRLAQLCTDWLIASTALYHPVNLLRMNADATVVEELT